MAQGASRESATSHGQCYRGPAFRKRPAPPLALFGDFEHATQAEPIESQHFLHAFLEKLAGVRIGHVIDLRDELLHPFAVLIQLSRSAKLNRLCDILDSLELRIHALRWPPRRSPHPGHCRVGMDVLDNASIPVFRCPAEVTVGTSYQGLGLLDLQFGSGDSRSLGDEFVARTKLLRIHAGELADRQAEGDDSLRLVPSRNSSTLSTSDETMESSCMRLLRRACIAAATSSMPAPGFATGRDDLDIRFELVNVGGERLHAHFHCGSEIDFVDHHNLRAEKHMRMLAHTPWALRLR